MNTNEFLNGRLPCSDLEVEFIEFAKGKDKEIESLVKALSTLNKSYSDWPMSVSDEDELFVTALLAKYGI